MGVGLESQGRLGSYGIPVLKEGKGLLGGQSGRKKYEGLKSLASVRLIVNSYDK